jgi:hypothetical protein
MIAFWSGQFLPGLEYFTTPFVAPIQPGIYSVGSGIYGVIILFFLSISFFLYHSRMQRRVFGPFDELDQQHALWGQIESLSQQTGVKVGRVLLDRDIRNFDAVAFGFLKGRTILMGKGMLLLSVKRPSDFAARLAHEFAHFKNGDIKYAFISRSMLQANILIMIVVVGWLCVQPLRVVLGQYYLFQAPAFGLPGASAEMFFRLHGIRWLHFWFNRSIGSLALTVPVFAFWTILLFLEYRSLLRTREMLADARAARWMGDRVLLDTLTSGKAHAAPTLNERLYEMFSAHPLVSERIAAVQEPENVLNPTLLRFLFLGYLFSLTTFLTSNVDTMMSIILGNYGKLRSNGDAMSAAISALTFENPAASFVYISVVLAFAGSYFVIIATLLRSCLSRKLSGQSTLKWLPWTLLQIAAVAAGNIIGLGFHPYSQAGQLTLSNHVMLGQSLSGLFFSSVTVADVTSQLQLCCILLATAILFWIEADLILRGFRTRPIRSIEWGFLMIFTFLFIYQIAAVIWVLQQFPDFRNLRFYFSGLLFTATFLILMCVIVRHLRGSFRKNRSTSEPPPWLLAA